MDWNLIRSLLDANLDQVLAKATDPAATLTALSRKISAAAEMVESHIATMDARAMEIPGLIGAEEAKMAKCEAVIAKADMEGKADLASAAKARLAKHRETHTALATEMAQLDGERSRADDARTKLEDRLADVESRGESGVSNENFDFAGLDAGPKPAPAAKPTPAPVAKPASAPAAPKPPASTSTPAAAPAKKGGGNLDDEFAALMTDLNVNLDEVELPKKKAPVSAKPVPKDDDLGLPDLVDVKDGDLGEGDEDDLPPLKAEKYNIPPPKPGQKGAPPAKVAPAKGAPPASPAAKPGAGAIAKAGASAIAKPAAAPPDAKKPGSKRWLWISGAVVAVGGAGAAVGHFVLHWF